MGSGVDDNLAKVGRICIDLLVARHPGIETNFAPGGADLSDGFTFYYQAVL